MPRIAAKTGTWGWEIQIYINTENGKNEGTNNKEASSSQRFTYTIFWLNRDPSTRKWTVEKRSYFGLNQPNPENIDLSFGGNECNDGKKGKWTWHDDPKAFCDSLKQEHEASYNDEAKRRKLMNYCYSYR